MTELDLAEFTAWPHGRVGFAVIVGRPNVGKSTFLNSLLDFHLCAVSNKPQTTRRNWRGILSNDASQIVFVDTPGAHVGSTILGEMMLDDVMTGLRDADIIVCIADPTRPCGAEDELVATRVGSAGKSCILLLNKTDESTVEQRAETREFYTGRLPADSKVFEICAKKRKQLDPVLDEIRQRLPEGPFFYAKDDVTDAVTRDIGAELIREAALALLRDEVPHSVAVEINSWKDGDKKVRIDATIHVERESHKGIVVGQGGAMINQIKRDAIKPLADLCDQRVDLRLYAKVSPDWRNRKRFLSDLGLAGGE